MPKNRAFDIPLLTLIPAAKKKRESLLGSMIGAGSI